MSRLFSRQSLHEFQSQLDQSLENFETRLHQASVRVEDFVQKSVTDSQLYEYLVSTKTIWERAQEMLSRAQVGDELKGTASEPNDPDFEEMILKRSSHGLIYQRLLCYQDPLDVMDLKSEFPEVPDGDLTPKEYIDWYNDFYEEWEGGNRLDYYDEAFTRSAMQCWHEALKKLQIGTAFRFSRHESVLIFDFLILHSAGGHSEAILAFPRASGQRLGGGFYTKHQRLANDFNLTLKRLKLE